MSMSGLSGLSALYRDGVDLKARLLALALANMVAYWVGDEPSGTTATDSSGNGRDGVDTNVTPAQPGVGDGRTADGFNGTTSKRNVYSAGLAAAINGPAGTLLLWFMVSANGVWTDATGRTLAAFVVNGSNSISIARSTTNGQLNCVYTAGGTLKNASITGLTGQTGWLSVALTWDKAADQVKSYRGGALINTLTGLGTWAGVPTSTGCVIGAASTTPTAVFSGSIAHVAVFNVALSATQVLQAATL